MKIALAQTNTIVGDLCGNAERILASSRRAAEAGADNASPHEIADSLHLPVTLVRDIVNTVDRNQDKRQQAAPALKVTTKALGIGVFRSPKGFPNDFPNP